MQQIISILTKSPFGGFRGAVFFLSLLLLFSCSDEHENIPGGEDNREYAVMKVDIRNVQQTPTYAEVEYNAFPIEREIRSIAFFTKTEDIGTDPAAPGFKVGAFNKFFSHEEANSTHGLYEPLEIAGDGYKAAIRIKSEAMGDAATGQKTKVIVIANYVENGLTDALMAVRQWDDLANVFTPAVKGNMQTPLVMVGSHDNVLLKEGETENVTFNLQRIVARIDVVNEGYNEQDPKLGFVLESAYLMHAREYSFLLPGNIERHTIPTVTSLPALNAGNAPANDRDRIVGLYLYETDNTGDGASKTSVFLRVELFGRTFSRAIPLKLADVSETQPGDLIPMLRNHRYQVVIKPFDEGSIEWDVKVEDWSDGTDIDIKPTLDKPLLENFTFENQASGSTWDGTTKTYVYDGTQNEVIRFTATGTHATHYDFKCELDGKGESLGLNNPENEAYKQLFKRGKPVLSYSSVSQEYTITLPKVVEPDVYAVPVNIKLFIRNEVNPYYVDSVMVRCIPAYPETVHQPVLLKGQYWAPVNVGAKEIDNTTPSLNTMGYYYQWGRNKAFDPSAYETQVGPVTYEESIGIYKDKFITNPNLDPYDWLKAGDPGMDTRDNLWSKEVNQTPCPKGWRIPTHDETLHLYNTIAPNGGAYSSIGNRFQVKGDESGKTLYFPNTKLILNDGSYYLQHPYLTWIHTSTKEGVYYKRWIYYYNTTTGPWHHARDNTPTVYGASIRCIQNVTP